MIKSEQRTSMRLVMSILAIAIVILHIVRFFQYDITNQRFISSLFLVIFSSVATLFIAFLDPKFHRLIAIPLSISLLSGIILSITSMLDIWRFFNTITIINYVITFFISIIIGIAQIYIFAKPKLFHLSDLVIFGIMVLNFFINLGRNIFSFATLSIIGDGIGINFMYLFLNVFLSPVLSLILLLLYILDAKQLSELEQTGQLYRDDPDKAKNMKALTKLYRDGHLTWNEYEEKKRILKEDM